MQPSAQGIASLFMGNPGALAQRVDQDRKTSPVGIPDDLRQLMALNIVTTENDAAKRQQALSQLQQMAPQGQAPTVADNVRMQAQQKMQARMVQEQQKQQALQQMMGGLPAAGIPPGVPQPERQPEPQGIDQAPVEFGMASGGIVSFQTGDLVEDQEEEETPPSNGIIDIYKDPVGAAKQRATEEKARYQEAIASPRRDIRDKLMAELEQQKAAQRSPEPGFAALAEYLSQIAATPRGMSSFEAGAAGARGLQALQKERSAQRGALTEKQLKLEQEQYNEDRQYAKDVYSVGGSEFDRMVKTYTALNREKGLNDRAAADLARKDALAKAKEVHEIKLENLKQENARILEGIKQQGRMAVAAVPGSTERVAREIATLEAKGTPEALAQANRLRTAYQSIQGTNAMAGAVNALRNNLTSQLRVHQGTLRDYSASKEKRENAQAEIDRIGRELKDLASGAIPQEGGAATPAASPSSQGGSNILKFDSKGNLIKG